MNKFVIVPKRVILIKYNPIKHFFKCEDGFMIKNLRFRVHIAKQNPPKMKLHVQIWLPGIHIVRDNSKWEIGNRYRLHLHH